jgi:hypothetical protein
MSANRMGDDRTTDANRPVSGWWMSRPCREKKRSYFASAFRCCENFKS